MYVDTQRMDTCICMAESLCSSPETITTLLMCYPTIQNKKLKKKKQYQSPGVVRTGLQITMGVWPCCPTLCDPVDCSPPGSSVHGLIQGRILEWVAISFSRVSFPARD